MINQQRLINTFTRIVQIDSPSGYEEPLALTLVRDLAALGITAKRDQIGNVIARIPGKGTRILLNAHLDTVEPGRGVIPILKQGVIRSKGNTILGADNKVAIAAILESLQSLHEHQLPHAPIDLIFTVSEEVANEGAMGLDYSKISARYGFTLDSGDKMGTITIASPFYNRFDIELIGAAAHASRPEAAKNVIPVLQKALSQIKLGRLSPETVCNIGLLTAGHARNTVPGGLMVHGEVRSFLRKELNASTQQIIKAFQRAAKGTGVKVSSDVVMENEGYLFDSSDPFIQFTKKIIKGLDVPAKTKRSSECYDANIFNSNGIRVVNIANNVQHMHTMKESIAVADLVDLTRIVMELMQQFARFKP